MKKKIFVIFIAFLILFVGCSLYYKEVQAEETTKGEVITEMLPSMMYNPTLDEGYTYGVDNRVSKTCFGSLSYTSLSLNVTDGNVSSGVFNGYTAYGITGTSINLTFKINCKGGVSESIAGSEWMLCDDSWGSVDGQNVNGVTTGKIGSGAIIIQTSSDGKTWSNDNAAKYNNGLYTTDYYKNYGTSEQVVYTPSGADVSKGIYIRVLYAYEIYRHVACTHPKKALGFLWQTGWQHEYDNEYINYLEEYSFYLCSNSVETVLFHNLSLEEQIEEEVSEEEKLQYELYKKTETLKNGSVTVTGFMIDKSLNETATVNVKRNGVYYEIPADSKIIENGRYDITVKTVLGDELTTTIYVHAYDSDVLNKVYFKREFLKGKRIFTKDSIPTYEGGFSYYNLVAVSEEHPLIWGTITNISTGTVIQIEQSNLLRSEILNEPGIYEARFNTNITYNSSEPAGDNQSFIFSFKIIAQGTAPGPQVNKESLENFSKLTNPTNLYSTYYGVTFQSAHKGYITLAFATKKAALEYAYNYEKGMVEEQEDGSFRYNGSLIVSQKVKYESAWDLTDAVYYFAEQAVQKLYFDLRDSFTYMTISDDILSSVDNLRTLELAKSVVVFASEDEKEAILVGNKMPIINSRIYSYLIPGEKGETKSGYTDFMFIKDKNGYDSNSIVIKNAQGQGYQIEYNVSVEKQLKEYNFETGIITIEEKTIYGDITTYQALYIAENDNTAKISINCYENDVQTIKTITSKDELTNLNTNGFSIASIVDEFDTYGIVIISKDNLEDYYCIDEKIDKIYTEGGIYTITLVNRLGYSYSFTINVSSKYYTTEIFGVGLENSQYLMYTDNDTLTLPELERYGYIFVGYKNSAGDIFSDEVQGILLKGSSALEAIWKAKQFNLEYIVDSSVYKQEAVSFGRTYTLPILQSTDTQEFIGWKNSNGDIITTLSIETEGDISLTAYYRLIEKAPDPSNEYDEETKRGVTIIVVSIVSIILMIIAHCIIQGGFVCGTGLMWGVSICLLAVLIIWVNLPWWALVLIELGGILVGSILSILIEE